MIRQTILATALLALAGCASMPPERQLVAAAQVPRASEELECMSDCLQGGDESCETCAARCLERFSAED